MSRIIAGRIFAPERFEEVRQISLLKLVVAVADVQNDFALMRISGTDDKSAGGRIAKGIFQQVAEN